MNKFENPKQPEKPEYIAARAVWFRDKVYTSHTIHLHAYDKIEKEYPEIPFEKLYAEATEGYTTTRGRFLNREEAEGMSIDPKDFFKPPSRLPDKS